MSAVGDALAQLAIVVNVIDPTPQDALVDTWVYPSEYGSISTASLPIAVCSRVVGQVGSIERRAFGVERHWWDAEVLILLATGPLEYPNAASAAAEAKQEEYVTAMAAALWANMTLNGTANRIGRSDAGGAELNLFDYMIDHMQWSQSVYWGIRFVIPVLQETARTMKAQ